MNKSLTKYFLYLLLLTSVRLPAAGVVNGDFESGVLTPWTVTYGGSMSGGIPTASVLGPGFAPYTNNNLSVVNSGNYSCELYSGWGDSGHQDFARISQPIYVDPSTAVLQFNVAAVLNGAHSTTPGEDAYSTNT